MRNMNKWFKEATTVEELRKQYRELLKKYHPDNENGSVEATQEINAEYDRLFSILSKESRADDNSYAYEENERFKTILNEITAFNMTVEIIGSWIWCFHCYPYKEQLKELGFTWCSKKKAWVWHDEPYHKYHREEIPLSRIRAKYGSQTVKHQSRRYSLD
jgi:curved DNA-binding protein CbpA